MSRHFAATQAGVTLIELLLAVAIGAVLLAGLNDLVKLGLDARAAGRDANELAYQGRFALERMADKARATAPKELATPAANSTGDWFSPTMFCRNAGNQLIETTTADTACAGTTVIAANVSAFAASPPVNTGPVDRFSGTLSLTLSSGTASLSLSARVRLGGGTL